MGSFRRKDANLAGSKKGPRKAQMDENVRTFVDAWSTLREKVVDVLLKMGNMRYENQDGQYRHGAIRFLWQPPIICSNFLRYAIGNKLVFSCRSFLFFTLRL